MKSGELDDQQHFKEDLTEMMINALNTAVKTFDSDEEEEDDIDENTDL